MGFFLPVADLLSTILNDKVIQSIQWVMQCCSNCTTIFRGEQKINVLPQENCCNDFISIIMQLPQEQLMNRASNEAINNYYHESIIFLANFHDFRKFFNLVISMYV